MNFVYPLPLPDTGISGISMRASAAVAVSESPFTFSQEVQAHQGQKWECEISLPPMIREKAEQWISFFLKLNGAEGTFLLGPEGAKEPRGPATGVPAVSGAGQSGQSLQTSGWTASTAGIMRMGDYFSLGSGTAARLYKIVNDVNSDGSGNATLDFWPRLRMAPGDGDLLTVRDASGVFRLSSNTMPHNIDTALFYTGMDFVCREVI